MPYKNPEDRRTQQRRWVKLNPEKVKAQRDRYRNKIRDKTIGYYSHYEYRCARCGFSDRRTLSIDHINSNGAKERRTLSQWNQGGYNFYNHLIKGNYPSGYQVLCMNCQWIKRHENKEYAK